MAKLKGAHVSKKSQATAYQAKIQSGKNKALNLARHLRKHPGDAQAEAAVKGAKQHTGRTQPKRVGARINPYINERDKIALGELYVELKQMPTTDTYVANSSRSLNLLNGRISATGKRVQQGLKLARAARAQAAFDRKGTVFPKPKLTQAERQLAKARALGKQEAADVSKAKQKKIAKGKTAGKKRA